MKIFLENVLFETGHEIFENLPTFRGIEFDNELSTDLVQIVVTLQDGSKTIGAVSKSNLKLGSITIQKKEIEK